MVTGASNVLHSRATSIAGSGSSITLDFGEEVGGLVSIHFAAASEAGQQLGLAFTESDMPVFGTWATGTTASASSVHPPNIVNGVTRTYDAANAIDGNLATFWNDNDQYQFPDTLTITAPAPATLTGVGFASFSDGVPTDFTVQTWDGANWVTQAAVSGNSQLYRWIPFSSPVTTTQVRLVVTATQDGFTRIAELTP
jgi:alpha-L-rhamnosidase